MALKKFTQLPSKNAKLDSILPKVDLSDVNVKATKTTFNQVFDITRETINVGEVTTTDGGQSFSLLVADLPTNKSLMYFYVKFPVDALAASTLDLGFGAKPLELKANDGQNYQFVDNGMIKGGGTYLLMYDSLASSGFVMMRPPVDRVTVSASSTVGNIATVASVTTPGSHLIDYQITVLPQNIPNVNLIIDLTADLDGGFGSLETTKTAASLKPGYWYKFLYTCIHKVPGTSYLNTNPLVQSFPGCTVVSEEFIVQAIDVDKLSFTTVRSLQYPEDIIHWRDTDSTVINQNAEEFIPSTFVNGKNNVINGSNIQYFLNPTTVSRAGRIYYREDTIQRTIAPYDYRSVVYIRYALKINAGGNYKFFGAVPLAPGPYFTGAIVEVNFRYYIVTEAFTALTTNLLDSSAFLKDITVVASGSKYLSTSNSLFVPFGYNGSQKIIEVDPLDFIFTKTFPIAIPTSVSQSFAYNVEIKDFAAAYVEAVTWEFYPDIVFYLGSNGSQPTNITIDGFSYDMTFVGAQNATIGSYCRNITLDGNIIGSPIVIGKNCRNIMMSNLRGPIGIGPDCSEIQVVGSNGIVKIGDSNTGISFNLNQPGERVEIGSDNANILLSSFDGTIGSGNTYIAVSNSFKYSIGNNNRSINDSYSNGGVIGERCEFIYLNAPTTLVEGITSLRDGDIVNGSSDVKIFTSGKNSIIKTINLKNIADPGLTLINSIFNTTEITNFSYTAGVVLYNTYLVVQLRQTYNIQDILSIPVGPGNYWICNFTNCDTLTLDRISPDGGFLQFESVLNSTFTNGLFNTSALIQNVKYATFTNIDLYYSNLINIHGITLGNMTLWYANLSNINTITMSLFTKVTVYYLSILNSRDISFSGLSATTNYDKLFIDKCVTVEINGNMSLSDAKIEGTSSLTLKVTAPTSISQFSITNANKMINPNTLVSSIVDLTAAVVTVKGVQFGMLVQDSVVLTNYYFCGIKQAIASGVQTSSPVKLLVA